MSDTEVNLRKSASTVLKEIAVAAGILACLALGFLYAAVLVYSLGRAVRSAWHGRRRDGVSAATFCALLLVLPFIVSCFVLTDYKAGPIHSKAWFATLHEGLDRDDIEDRMQRLADDLEAGMVRVVEAERFRFADALDTKIFVQLGIRPWLHWQHSDTLPDDIEVDDLLPITDILASRQTLYLAYVDKEKREEVFHLVTCHFREEGQLLRVTPISPGFFRNVLDDERYVTLVDTCRRAQSMLSAGETEGESLSEAEFEAHLSGTRTPS